MRCGSVRSFPSRGYHIVRTAARLAFSCNVAAAEERRPPLSPWQRCYPMRGTTSPQEVPQSSLLVQPFVPDWQRRGEESAWRALNGRQLARDSRGKCVIPAVIGTEAVGCSEAEAGEESDSMTTLRCTPTNVLGQSRTGKRVRWITSFSPAAMVIAVKQVGPHIHDRRPATSR